MPVPHTLLDNLARQNHRGLARVLTMPNPLPKILPRWEMASGTNTAKLMKTLFGLLLFVAVAFPAPPQPATLNDFRTAPVVRPLLPDHLLVPSFVRELPSQEGRWDMENIRNPIQGEIESIVLQGVPKRLKWQTVPNTNYRVIVSDNGTNFWVYAHTRTWNKIGWAEWPTEVPMPTNKFVKVVSP